MRFENMSILYHKLYKWLTMKTPGERSNVSRFKYYQKELWNPVLEIIDEISKEENPTDKEKEFINLVKYKGTVYRKQKYNPKNRGHIYFHGYYQSGSKDLEGLSNVSNYYRDVLLIITKEITGINVKELLKFMCRHRYADTSAVRLERYLKEKEIVFGMKEDSIKEIVVVDNNKLLEWETEGKALEKCKWKRNNMR